MFDNLSLLSPEDLVTILKSRGSYEPTPPNGTWRCDPRLIASLFRFMNPLRIFDLETLFTQHGKTFVTLTGTSYLFDLLGRITLTYGYYQTIQAFRRFGRK